MFLQKCIPIHEWFLHFYGKVLDIPIINGYRLKPVICSMHFLYLHFPNEVLFLTPFGSTVLVTMRWEMKDAEPSQRL